MVHVLVELRKQFINNVVFHTWACAAGFINNKEPFGMRLAEGRRVNMVDMNCFRSVVGVTP